MKMVKKSAIKTKNYIFSFLPFLLFRCGTSSVEPPSKDFVTEENVLPDYSDEHVEVDAMDFQEDLVEAEDLPRRCAGDYECQNGIFCDGQERCVDGECMPADKPACEDDIECTEATCDEERDECHYEVNNAICDDGLFCNGQERCSVLYGCVNGTAPDCSDTDRCTTDYCDEENDRCVYAPKDNDSDGFVDRSCGGDDCNDSDPQIHPGVEEICDDGKDNDCNNLIDTSDPVCLEHLCDAAQVINVDFSGGNFTWTGSGSTAGGTNNFEATCAGNARSPDVPYKLIIPSRASVVIEVTSASYDTALHVRTRCGDPASQIYCDDDGGSCSLCSRISATLDAGTYIVIQDGFGSGSSGTYTLRITANPI